MNVPRRLTALLLVSLAAVLAVPAAAAADSTVSVQGDTVRLVGDETPNRVILFYYDTPQGRFFQAGAFSAPASPGSPGNVRQGPGCAAPDQFGNVNCPADGVTKVDVSLGGGDDRLNLDGLGIELASKRIDLGAGDDYATTGDPGGPSSDADVIAGAGDDEIDMRSGGTVSLGDGDDSIAAPTRGRDAMRVTGGAGNDDLFCASGGGTRFLGRFTIDAGAGRDRTCTFGGADRVDAGSGDDRVATGDGDDVIDAGSGDDLVDSGDDDDRITGGSGEDELSAGRGDDDVRARDGDVDEVRCGAGRRDKVVNDGADELNKCERRSRP